MAHVRLIALALLAACTSAGAEPTVGSGIKPPAGWIAQPLIATAAKDALGKKATIDGVEAFGEPGMGCYSVWMSLRASGSAKEVAEQLVRGLAAPPEKPTKDNPKPSQRKLEIKDVVKPTAETGVMSFAFESAPYKGRFRARLGGGRIVALACWSSQREPAACEQACTTVLGALP